MTVATTNKPELGSELARRNRPESRLCQWMTKRRWSWRGGGTLLRAEGASISSGEEVAEDLDLKALMKRGNALEDTYRGWFIRDFLSKSLL